MNSLVAFFKQENVESCSLLQQKQIFEFEYIMRLNIFGSQSAQTGMYCTGFSKRQSTIYQADVSYDSTAGCVNRHKLLHVYKTWSLPLFSLCLKFLNIDKRQTHMKKKDYCYLERLETGLRSIGPTLSQQVQDFCCGLSG